MSYTPWQPSTPSAPSSPHNKRKNALVALAVLALAIVGLVLLGLNYRGGSNSNSTPVAALPTPTVVAGITTQATPGRPGGVNGPSQLTPSMTPETSTAQATDGPSSSE